MQVKTIHTDNLRQKLCRSSFELAGHELLDVDSNNCEKNLPYRMIWYRWVSEGVVRMLRCLLRVLIHMTH